MSDSPPDSNEQPGIAPEDISRYSVNRDPHSEQDIARYVEIEAPDEIVKHVEKIRRDIVFNDEYDIWDVTTDKDRWWVITNLTNMYSQGSFPSLDYALSFHIGLMRRVISRNSRVDIDDPDPFDEVYRRQDQAEHRFDSAVEAEDYQSVGMLLRECLISLVAVLRRRVDIAGGVDRPKDSDFVNWTSILLDTMCHGPSQKRLRQYLKSTAKETWQLVNWLTHARRANKTDASIAIHACNTIVGHSVQLLQRSRVDRVDECLTCGSRDVRTHYDSAIEPDGDYYLSCGVCDWTNHPHA